MSIQNDHFYFKVIYPFKFKECYPLVELCGRRVWRDGSETERESERQRERGDGVNVIQKKLSGLVMTEVWKAIGLSPESPPGMFFHSPSEG